MYKSYRKLRKQATHPGVRWTVLLLLCLGTSGPAHAAERCNLLGQIAISNWLGMLGTLNSNDPARIDPAMDRVQRAVALFETADCDMGALTGAMECVLTADAGDTAKARALRCLQTAGLSRAP